MQNSECDGMAEISSCRLCPRECAIDRTAGELGFCRAGSELEIFRYGPHHGEEPPISGLNGSGTVFFSRCTMNCSYCQNYPWSQDGEGSVYSVEAFAGVLKELKRRGCHNWNFVSPTPWLPLILEALDMVSCEGITLPVVYNTSGYEKLEIIRRLDGVASVYLPDLRYASDETSRAASSAPGYTERARAAIAEMWRQTGPLAVDDDGVAVSGTICRMLILPGHASEAVDNLKWLAENIGTELPLSLMAQYRPVHRAAECAPWNRGISKEEYDLVVGTAEELGFGNGWIQDYKGDTPDELLGWEMEES